MMTPTIPVSALDTTYVTPSTPPTFTVSYNSLTKLIHAQVDLTYYSSENIQYTYLFGFSPWNTEFNLFSNNNCTNRQTQDFSPNNPPLWTSLWAKLCDLNETAISGDYLSWPNPSFPWKVSIVSQTKSTADASSGKLASSGIVNYAANFTIETLINCAGSELVSYITEDYFIYSGTFYVVWIQPIEAYLPVGGAYGLNGVYSTKSYQFPFVVQVNRHVDTVDEDPHTPSYIYSYILGLEWKVYSSYVDASGQVIASYKLHLSLRTKTPASKYSDGTVANYNRLSPLSLFLMPTSSLSTDFYLTLNVTDSQTDCDASVISSASGGSYCVQHWSYVSQPYYNLSVNFNETYYFAAKIQSCYFANSSAAAMTQGESPTLCSDTALVTSVTISFDPSLQGSTVINVADKFSANITYYTDRTVTTVYQGTSYLPGQDIVAKHWANLYPLNDNYYTLIVQNVYVCGIVQGGHVPYLGYDASLNMWRNGCRSEEYVSGVLNIPSSYIFVVATNNTAGSCCSYENIANLTLLKSQDAILFSTASFFATEGLTSFYIHIESELYYSNGLSSEDFQLSSATQSSSGSEASRGKLYSFGSVRHFSIVRDDEDHEPSSPSASSITSGMSTAAIIGTSVGASTGFLCFVAITVIVFLKRKRLQAPTPAIIPGSAATASPFPHTIGNVFPLSPKTSSAPASPSIRIPNPVAVDEEMAMEVARAARNAADDITSEFDPIVQCTMR